MKVLLYISCLLAFCLSAQAQGSYAFKRTYTYTRRDGRRGKVKLKTRSDSLSVIQYYIGRKKSDEWRLKCPVYQFECGDINGDGLPEIAVGVVKSTRYSRFEARRLHIFKLYNEAVIRPLWLGSRTSHELLDFHIESLDRGTFIRTTERSTSGEQIEIRYKTAGFGLKFEEYVKTTTKP